MRKILEKRFEFLYKGERFAIIVFIPVIFLIPNAYPNLQLYSLLSFWISFFFLQFVLIQGVYYWHSKWKRLVTEEKSITPIRIVKHLKKLKTVNIGIIIFTVFVFFIDLFIHYPTLPIGGLMLSGFVFIFSILEFINYFYVQLSYDNRSDIRHLIKTKKLKRSSLSRDFKRIR